MTTQKKNHFADFGAPTSYGAHIFRVEIGSKKDVEAINEALRAGIKLIATVHGSSLQEIMEKSSMNELFKERVFDRFIILDRSKGVGTIKELVDGESLKPLKI